MTTLVKANLDRPVSSRQDLIDYLAGAAKPPERWGIGAEAEKLVIDAETGEAANYQQIEALLSRLEDLGMWQGLREDGHLVGLVGQASSITLEPGGQLELSGKLCQDVHCCHGDLSQHIDQILNAAEPLGLRFLGYGVQPFTPLERIDWVPKARYRIMGPYMLRTGDMGQRMMKQSAGLQVNIDFSDESDCIAKMRTALKLSPLLYALFANSPIMEDRPTGCLSTRGEIWARTDPDRTGLLPHIFAPDAGYGTFVDYALNVPMYFIFRDARFIDFTGSRISFRRFLEDGHAGHRATMADWDLHLSTLFPEVRLRPQIEVRCADSLPPHLTMAVAALIKGLLYDQGALQETADLFGGLATPADGNVFRNSWRQGLKTSVNGTTLQEMVLEVLAIARRGLAKQRRLSGRGTDETIYLDGIQQIAESGETLAERLLARWSGSRQQKIDILMEHCGFSGHLD
jgi:glutamate--cysteine ligase